MYAQSNKVGALPLLCLSASNTAGTKEIAELI